MRFPQALPAVHQACMTPLCRLAESCPPTGGVQPQRLFMEGIRPRKPEAQTLVILLTRTSGSRTLKNQLGQEPGDCCPQDAQDLAVTTGIAGRTAIPEVQSLTKSQLQNLSPL